MSYFIVNRCRVLMLLLNLVLQAKIRSMATRQVPNYTTLDLWRLLATSPVSTLLSYYHKYNYIAQISSEPQMRVTGHSTVVKSVCI